MSVIEFQDRSVRLLGRRCVRNPGRALKLALPNLRHEGGEYAEQRRLCVNQL
jgi:hypothetical protein